MRYFIIIIFFALGATAKMSDFAQFAQFEKRDKQMFSQLKQEIKQCIDTDNFSCAQKKLHQIKQYVTSKHNVQTVRALKKSLAQAIEQKRALAQHNKSIRITNCQYKNSSTTMCTLYVNGQYDGNIFYKRKDDTFTIYILGSKNATTTEGFYDPNLHRVWTTRCGDSVYNRSNQRFVYKIGTALYMFANCAINGKY